MRVMHKVSGLPMRKGPGVRVSILMTLLMLCVAILGALAHPGDAGAFFADFFEKDVSGTGTYEAMVVHPNARYDEANDRTIVAYQGKELDPYVIAYDHARSSWSEPVRVGANPLTQDTHGGPAICIDARGRVHVFYGTHSGLMLHSISGPGGDISTWETDLTIPTGPTALTARGTYAQPLVHADGRISFYYRSARSETYGQWVRIESIDDGDTWSAPDPVLLHDPVNTSVTFYANFNLGEGDVTHVAFLRKDYESADQFDRNDVYYMYLDPADDTWKNASGKPLSSPPDTITAQRECAVLIDPVRSVNQVVVRDLGGDVPGILFLHRAQDDPEVDEWKFARLSRGIPAGEDAVWEISTLTATDHLFDAGDFESLGEGVLEAFVVTGGLPDDQTSPDDDLAARGGDIAQFRSEDGGRTWSTTRMVITSPGAETRYNNPQLVSGARHDAARLVFSEWNNDFSNFIHKVFLCGDDGSGGLAFLQREFNPETTRLAGTDRIGTSVAVSSEAWYDDSGAVVLASRDGFPDALCGAPLAQFYRAPVLLTARYHIDARVADELRRLVPDGGRVVFLGSSSAISVTARNEVKALLADRDVTYEEIGGQDRYETSALIAKRVAKLRGAPDKAIIATGVDFADALSISPFAARKGYPILLVQPDALPDVIEGRLKDSGAKDIIVVGGPSAVSDNVEQAALQVTGGSSVRLSGDDRYETARAVGEFAMADGALDMERFVLCSGENFPDAVVGGALAARFHGSLVLTRKGSIPESSIGLLQTKAWNVLNAYVLGSDAAVEPVVENALQSILQERQD